jgi:hypothetical protein
VPVNLNCCSDHLSGPFVGYGNLLRTSVHLRVPLCELCVSVVSSS